MRLSGSPRVQGWRLARTIRGARLDRNPLRRGTDRLETCLLAGLFVGLAAGAPFAVRAASHASYVASMQARQEQLATRHQVRAVLTRDAASSSGYTLSSHVLTQASWTSVTGVRRSGEVPAQPGSRRGTDVVMWVDDASGDLDGPPVTVAEAAAQSDATMVGVIAGSGMAGLVGAVAIRQVLNRRRMAAWDADWTVTAQAWNRQRW